MQIIDSPNEVTIRNENEAYDILEKLLSGAIDARNVRLNFDGWPLVHLHVKGKEWDSSLTPTLMQGLIDLQKAVYRAHALNCYGSANVTKLKDDEKDALEFRAQVGPGSSDISISLGAQTTAILQKLADKMTPELIAITVVSLAVIWGGGAALRVYFERDKEKVLAKLQSEQAIAQLEQVKFMSQEETKRLEILSRAISANPRIEQVADQTADAMRTIVKSCSDADETILQGVSLSSEVAQQLTSTTRNTSNEVRLDGEYTVLAVNSSDPLEYKVSLLPKGQDRHFLATVKSDAVALDPKIKQTLQIALFDRSAIFLFVLGRKKGDVVTEATIKGAIEVRIKV